MRINELDLLTAGHASPANGVPMAPGQAQTWAEQELLRLNRALRVLSACNRAVTTSRDETSLLHQVCRIVVEVGGYGTVWVSYAEDDDAKTILARYTSELDDTYVAYSGTPQLTERDDYVRVDGPSVWIEFSMQHGIVLAGNHPHSVWRDRSTDYGGTKS